MFQRQQQGFFCEYIRLEENVDNQYRKTFVDVADTELVQVTGQAGADKRFGTLQVCCHGGRGPQPALEIWFRGKGTVLAGEKDSYHPKVMVHFNDKAWANDETLVNWSEQTLKKYVNESIPGKPFLLMQDNLGNQRKKKYIEKVKETSS